MFIEQEKAKHSVERMCFVLEVSKSGYYAWCADEGLAVVIDAYSRMVVGWSRRAFSQR